MWAYIYHFHTEDADSGYLTQDCGVEVEFDQSSRSSHHDENHIEEELGYVGMIQEIIQVYFSSFQCVVFKCKWRDAFDWNNVKVDHDSGIICINFKKKLIETNEPYVFPKCFNQVFFTQMCYIRIGGSHWDMIQDLNIFLRTIML